MEPSSSAGAGTTFEKRGNERGAACVEWQAGLEWRDGHVAVRGYDSCSQRA